MIVAQAVVDLTAPKQPARQASEMTIALGEQPRCAQFGETFTPGTLVDGFDYGGKYGTDWEVLIIRLADHKCEGLSYFFVNDEKVIYTGDGNYPQFDEHHFKLYFRADTSNDPLPDIVLDNGPGWTSSDLGKSGCDVIVAYLADKPDAKKPAWPGGRPHFGFVIKGKLCYDPRKDDTVAGGSGAHRWDDPATWEWSENPVVCRYNWVRGIYAEDDTADETKLLVGRGLTAEEAPPENIIAPANLCDEIPSNTPLKYVQAAGSSTVSGGGFSFSPDGLMIRWDTDGNIEWYSSGTQTPLRVSSPSSGDGAEAGTVTNVAISRNGTAYYYGTTLLDGFNHLYVTPQLGSTTMGVSIGDSSHRFPGPCRVFDFSDDTVSIYGGTTQGGYYFGESLISGTQAAVDFCLDELRNVWALFQPTGTSNQFIIKQITGGTASFTVTGAATRSGPSTAYFCKVASQTQFFVLSDGHWYTIDASTGAIKASGTQSYQTRGEWNSGRLQQSPGSQTTFWSDMDQISLESGSILQSLTASDWVATGVNDAAYDPVNNAIVSRDGVLSHDVTWRFLEIGVRFRIAGPVYSNQDFIDVEQMFAAAVAGNVITHEGSVELEPAQAKSVVASFTDDDLLVASEVRWNQGFLSESDAEWVNSVVSTYVEPDQKWNSHAAPIARDTSDILTDGRPREAQITLRLVRDGPQAQVIAEITRRLGRLWGRATVKLGPRFCEIEDGDWIEWTSDRYLGGATKTFRVDAYSIDEKWQNTLTLREISVSVFADDTPFVLDQSSRTTTPPPPDIGSPDSGDWTGSATTIESSGASVPVIEITGAVPDDENVESIIVEYWLDDGVHDPVSSPDSVTWTLYGTFPPDTTKIDITGLNGGTYYVALTYVVSGEPGDRLVLGPLTVSAIDVSGQLLLTIDPITTTTYTIAATDDWHHKRFTNSSAITVTVPTNATAAYPVGARTRLTAAGTGQITLSPAVGVTLNSRDAALKSTAQFAVFEIEKVATDEWDVLGDVTA
jgi:hypothetical protein